MEAKGNYKPNEEFVSAIKGLRFTMRFLGIWQQTNLRGWYNLVWYVHSIGYSFHLFGPTAGLIINRHDASKTIGNLGPLTPTISTFFNWITFAVHSETVGKLLDFIEKDWFDLEKDTLIGQSVPGSKQLMKKHYQSANTFFFTFISMMMLGMMTFLQDSLSSRGPPTNGTDEDRANLFPLPYSWFPLDYDRGYTVQILFVTQTITSTTLSLASASIDTFFITATLHLCAQFEILRYFTESITNDFSQPECCKMKVRRMIGRHQELLRAVEKIQKLYNLIIVRQYAAVTLTLCFLGYAIVVEMEKTDSSTTVVIKSAFVCGAFLLLIFSYCFVGDRLTNESWPNVILTLQSIAVATAVYNSDWYNCPRSICLSFLVVMARANRPVEITGAKLMTMSLGSFTSLIKASASYISVLRAVGVSDG